MINMKNHTCSLTGYVLLATSLFVVSGSGCDSSIRREGVGGGARTPVRVTFLRDATSSSEAEADPAAAGPKISEFGTVRGRIVVDGALPSFAPLLAQGASTKDSICSETAVLNESAIGEGGGLGNVFVYLRRVPNVDVPSPSDTVVEVDQRGCVFMPHAQVVQVGQPLLLKNSDPVAHNVNIKGRANNFNSTIPPSNAGDLTYQFQFAEQRPALMVCDFHGWMAAYMLPVDHPWAVVSNPDGTFEIPNVPAGSMEFVVWHEKLDFIERALTVSVPPNGEADPIEIRVNAARLSN